MNKHCSCILGIVCVLVMTVPAVASHWTTILYEDFETDPSPNWAYAGEQNGTSQDLIRWDPNTGRLAAEWDQSNHYRDWDGASVLDPYEILPSRYSHPLDQTLTDDDTFKFGARLRINSVVNTTEFYQVANFGLYNLSNMGGDRAMSDNFSGNVNLVKDGADFVEFNYFIENESFGWNPMTQCTMGAHIDALTGNYFAGSGSDPLFHDTDMGASNWLPTATNLYVEVTYDAISRRAYSAIYTDPNRTTILSVNGVQQYYWTVPLPGDKHFTLTDVAVWNYVGANWGGANGTGSGSFDDVYVSVEDPHIVGRWVFYNNSKWDGEEPAVNANDDAAIATDKQAMLPGETATFANYTSYSRGINGVMMDIKHLLTAPSAADFTFKVGNSNDPTSWATAPAPVSVSVRSGVGVGGADRVTIIWTDNAIQKEWLQVTVLATGNTGLVEDDVFYFGNAVGDTGNSATDTYVNASDRLGCRANPHHFLDPAPIDDAYDFNRDKNVNASDRLIARANPTNFTNALQLISVPG